MRKMIGLFSLVVMLNACEYVTFEGGQIPAEYLSAVKIFEGNYVGSFKGKPAQITIRFDQNIPKLEYQDTSGTDMLEGICQSKINKIEHATLSKKNETFSIDEVGFNFDPGKCRIEGRSLHLNFYHKNDGSITMRAAILERTTREYTPNHFTKHYFKGRFTKQ